MIGKSELSAAAIAACICCGSQAGMGQAPPGPVEILPFQDACIVEAWFDLLSGTQIADWTGWTGSSWVSPHAYNGHTGTDWALDTGTPLYAAAPGQVVAVNTNIPENTGASYGNYVRIALTGTGPLGQNLDVITAHMLPTVQVTVGQALTTGQQTGQSDNTGDSTSEHCHLELIDRGTGTYLCPFYNALFKYPIMFNPSGTVQVGHVVKVTAASTPVRSDRFDSSAVITTAYANQHFFAAYWHRGYLRVFIPNNTSNRGGWIRATDVTEVFEGTVIQPLPDAGGYVHATTLATPVPIRSTPDGSASVLGQIVFGGGRFVADQIQSGWYRIPVPGSAAWGWVLPTSRVVVYPTLTNPSVNLAARPSSDFPLQDNFNTVGRSEFGRPKFNHPTVQTFTPSSPGGDGNALFLTDVINFGDGVCESVIAGKPGHTDYFVQTDCYFSYKPTQGGYERYGVFLRDDGFGGMDQTFEGSGNCYAITWDTDDGRLRAAKIVDATITDLMPAARYEPASGWHRLRIEARGSQIRYLMDGSLLVEVTDATFASGPCGIGFSNHTTASPAGRGAWFDNFQANALPPATVADWALYD